MKLRNKMTGESGELYYYPDKAYHFAVSAKDPTQTGIYKTLGELLQDWTDFTVHEPAEPLIKDKKNRKAVRAWAEANGIEQVIIDKSFSTYIFCPSDTDRISISVWTEPSLSNLSKDKIYTITELCGEEEE